ncbi:hypothetical protein JTE90_010085 [Oedothorax gibbosus]|uniref:RING-type domain-containing protein n=1 Tax=Oedothorax gibbosus TaxID=931172 RepID=A0AAV6U455_9ARAC|nr:hypothetical protein JTE90_010085 [Oedothorax gibbosus]
MSSTSTTIMPLVCDPLRDQALLAYKFQSKADLFGFTDYMIMCSEIIRAVDIDDSPELIVSETVWTLFDIFGQHFKINDENIFHYMSLVWHPFSDLAAVDLIEDLAKNYAGSRVPVIHWLWKDFLLPKLYNLLRSSWPAHRLTAQQLTWTVSQLKETLYRHTWPDSYFESAEVCTLCTDICITHKYSLNCGHWGCHECIIRWLKDNNTCPYCRAPIYEDLAREQDD